MTTPATFEDVSDIFWDTPKSPAVAFQEVMEKFNSAKTQEELDSILESAPKVWVNETGMNTLKTMATYKRKELPSVPVVQSQPEPVQETTTERPKQAAEMKIMSECIDSLNASKSFEEMQTVLETKKDLFAQLNNGQNQIIIGIIDGLSKKLPASLPKEVVDTPITDSAVVPNQEPTSVAELIATPEPKKTRKKKEEVKEETKEVPAVEPEPIYIPSDSFPKVINITRRINFPINGIQYSNNETIIQASVVEHEYEEYLTKMNNLIREDVGTRLNLVSKEELDKAVEKARQEGIEEGKKLGGNYQAWVMDGIVTQNGGDTMKADLELEVKANEHFRWFLNLLAKNDLAIAILSNGVQDTIGQYVRSEYATYCESNPNPKKK